jgi:hypothetical protein
MSKRNAIFAATLAISPLVSSAWAQDVNPTVNKPDKFAWDLFMALSRPADPMRPGEPDPNKKLGDEGETVWESWKLAGDVFPENGCKPAGWGEKIVVASARPRRFFDPGSTAELFLEREARRQVSRQVIVPTFAPPSAPGRTTSAETRMNKAAFDFIVTNQLYNIDGQEKFHDDGRAIDLPPEAREIKSSWRVLSDDEVKAGARRRYHTADFDNKVWGLVALHIITKDIPQWFWSTFEHIDTPDIDIRRGERFFDRYTGGGVPDPVKGTKWESYRLKGTQTEFVSLNGEPNVLANAIIERGLQGTSSCVTCHAHATIGPKDPRLVDEKGVIQDNRLPFFAKIDVRRFDETSANPKAVFFITGWMGTPDPRLFTNPANTRDKRYTQTDFMWSFMRASRKSATCKD